MQRPVRVPHLAPIEQCDDIRQQISSSSDWVTCEKFIAVFVGPETQCQSTARLSAVVAKTHLHILAAVIDGDLSRMRRIKPAIRASFSNYVGARREVAKRGAATGTTGLWQGREARIRHRTEAKRPIGQTLLALIFRAVCVEVVILANSNRRSRAATLARRIFPCKGTILIERSRTQMTLVATGASIYVILSWPPCVQYSIGIVKH